MAIPSPRSDALGSRRPSTPLDWYDPAEHRRKLAESLNIADAELQDLLDFVRLHTVVAIYGGMRTTSTTGTYVLGAGFTKFTDFDSENVTAKGTSFDTTNDTFTIFAPGIYMFYMEFVFDHNESNQGRTFDIRIFNNTDSSVALGPITIGVGRNTPYTNFYYQIMFDVDTSEDDELIVEIGNASSSITGEFDEFEIGVYSIGEFKGTEFLIDPADPRND